MAEPIKPVAPVTKIRMTIFSFISVEGRIRSEPIQRITGAIASCNNQDDDESDTI
jgi:hypothetical protein